MKKILYGIVLLLGIGFISTNFIIDTNTVDHKIVKAGGTACKWISDTGYGTGPIYYSCADYKDEKEKDEMERKAFYE